MEAEQASEPKSPTKPSLEAVAPRKPGNMPAGASLADRIAALQKSSSVRSSQGRYDRSASSTVGGASTSAVEPTGQGRSVSSGPRPGGPGGVRDRIAKFQADEKPLIPKSSFGSPAPMHGERNQNALRPYPGANATGGGSGQWGEGVLRPQMTGGAWAGSGEGRGWQGGEAVGNVRPQLTGGAWLGVGGGSPSSAKYKTSLSPNGSLSRAPLKQRDAFLDLDEESSQSSSSPQKIKPPLRRDSSFSGAQLAAAQMGLSRSPRPGSTDGTAESLEGHSSPATESRGRETASNVTTVPDLPNAPTQDIGSARSDSKEKLVPTMVNLPSTPSGVPTIRSPIPQLAVSTNDVEISVANVTPERLEKLRRTASGSYADSLMASPVSDESADQLRESGRAALFSDIHARREKRRSMAAKSGASADDATTDIGRLIISSNDTDDGSIVESPPARSQDLPSRAHVQRTESDRVDPSDPRAHQVMGAGLLVPQDELAAKSADADVPSNDIATPAAEKPVEVPGGGQNVSHRRSTSNESGIIDPVAISGSQSTDTVKGKPAAPTNGHSIVPAFADEPGSGTVTGMTKHNSEGLDERQSASAAAAAKAKETISAARNRSQRLKRPPPGRMMTAAEMDASDDEYEPGWASVTTVFSSSRQT